MIKKIYDASLIKTMSLFEQVTHASLKDSFVDSHSSLVFVVDEQQMSKAIGKGGRNVHRLEKLLNRKIKILGFTPDMEQFIRNMVYPLKPKNVVLEGDRVTITGKDTHMRALLIGKNSQNLKNYLSIVQRYFDDVKEIKVI
jgi:N utilization substance protein A